MPADKFICGNCQSSFSEIEDFMLHKKDGCDSVVNETVENDLLPVDLGKLIIIIQRRCLLVPCQIKLL